MSTSSSAWPPSAMTRHGRTADPRPGTESTLKYGAQIGILGHFFSAAAADLNLDNSGTAAGTPSRGVDQGAVLVVIEIRKVPQVYRTRRFTSRLRFDP